MEKGLEFSAELFITLSRFLKSLDNDSMEMYVMHSEFRPESNMPMVNWIKRIYSMSRCSSSCLIIAAFFLKKVNYLHPSLIFSEVNLRRLFLTAVMLSAKMNEDRIFKNGEWVRIGEGVYTLEIVNRMETELLSLLNYELFVEIDHYDAFCDYLASNFQKIPCDSIHPKVASFSILSPNAKDLNVQQAGIDRENNINTSPSLSIHPSSQSPSTNIISPSSVQTSFSSKFSVSDYNF
jgi:hypothetical protein